jgi:hypothetical protein
MIPSSLVMTSTIMAGDSVMVQVVPAILERDDTLLKVKAITVTDLGLLDVGMVGCECIR